MAIRRSKRRVGARAKCSGEWNPPPDLPLGSRSEVPRQRRLSALSKFRMASEFAEETLDLLYLADSRIAEASSTKPGKS